MCKKLLSFLLVAVLCLGLIVTASAQTAAVTLNFSQDLIRISQTDVLTVTVPEDALSVTAYFVDNGKLGVDRSNMQYDPAAGKYKLTFIPENGVYSLNVTARYVGVAQITLTNIVCETATGNIIAPDAAAQVLVKPAATPIYTKQDLNAVRNDLSGNYLLMNDIVFEESDFQEGGEFYNNGYGWQPIGSSLYAPFKGDFDGNGYSITGLTVNKADYNYIGLFGVNIGNIENLELVSVKIDARYGVYVPVTESSGTSGKIDYESKDVWTPPSGSVNDSDLSGYDRDGESSAIAGGIAGYNIGTVKNCYVGGNVYATPLAGGVAGSNVGSISECYVTANVSAKAAGGIAGYNLNHGVIVDCHTNCEITASVLAGGICAENRSSEISFVYAFTTFAGVAETAAISNGSYYSAVNNAYYLKDDTITDPAATAITKQEFAELRFENECWDYSGEYPVLKSFADYIEPEPDVPGPVDPPPEIKIGDVNGDGEVNTADLAVLKKLVAGLIANDSADVKNPDVNKDEEVNTTDLALLKKIVAGLETV